MRGLSSFSGFSSVSSFRGAIILLLLTSSAAVQAYACDLDENTPLQGNKYRWMMGFDVANEIMHPKNDFTYLTYGQRHGMDLYAAYRMLGPWGFELGYFWTNDHALNVYTVPGTQLFGATAQTTALYQFKLRVEYYYLDAYWHYKFKNILEFKAGIGVAFDRQNIAFYDNEGVTDPVATAIGILETTTTVTPRFNIGAQTMLTNHIGARALFGLRLTSGIKAVNCAAGVNPHMFGTSYTVSIGLFYTVTGYYDD